MPCVPVKAQCNVQRVASRPLEAASSRLRFQGKLDTENLLDRSGVNWTSIRPVYIYGPLNYNPVEEWFFHR